MEIPLRTHRSDLALILVVATCGVPAFGADIDKLSARCRAGETKACTDLIKIAKTARETGVWLAALKEVADAPTKTAIADARFATLQTRDGVKRGVLLGRLVLCSPTRPPEAAQSRHLRGCLLVSGDRIQEVAASGVRIAEGSEETALVILSAKPDEFSLETLLAAMTQMRGLGSAAWNVGGTSVESKSITVQKVHTVPMSIIGSWDPARQRLDSFIGFSTLNGVNPVSAEQLAPAQ